jgi:hypothetical protein
LGLGKYREFLGFGCVAKLRNTPPINNPNTCTVDIRPVIANHPDYGSVFTLVDTPGFDDAYKSDIEIPTVITDWVVNRHVYLIDRELVLTPTAVQLYEEC